MAGGQDANATLPVRDCRGRFARERRDCNGRARDSFGRFVHEDFARAYPGRDERVAPERVRNARQRREQWQYAQIDTTDQTTAGPGWDLQVAVTRPRFINSNYTHYPAGSSPYWENYTPTTASTNNSVWYQQAELGALGSTVTAETRIDEAEFDQHPDPDALLGEGMDSLRRKLEEALGMTLARDEVWVNWASESLNGEVLLRAEWTPRKLTIEAWDAWQKIPKLRRIYDQATRSYIEVTEEELRRREWVQKNYRMVIRNRGRTAKLRENIAQRRARALLLEMLDEAQTEQWEREKAFTIETADGLRQYRIRHGVAGNITLIKDGDRAAAPGSYLRRYCFHAYYPGGDMPVEDNVLAQKLFIEADEEGFLALANDA